MKRESLSSETGDYDLPETIVRDLKSEDVETQMKAVIAASSILYNKDLPISVMVQAGVIEPLLDALDRDDHPDLQCRALDVLTNVAFGSFDHSADIINSGVIPKLITFLAREDDLAERAIVTLGNYALHGAEARDAMLALGALQAMLPHMHKDTPLRKLKTIMRTYNSLCSQNEAQFEPILPALPYINELLDIEDEEEPDEEDEKPPKINEPPWLLKHKPHVAADVVEAACTVLANIMYGGDMYIEEVQAVPGLTARLVALLGHETSKVKEAALSAVGNMLGGNDAQVDRCLSANCLEHVMSLLQCSNSSLVQGAARAAGNILAGTHAQIQQALQKDVLSPLQNILASGEPQCQMQAACAVTYLCSYGTAAQCGRLVPGVLEPYCALLAAPDCVLAGEVLDGLYELLLVAERDGNVKPLCYMLDEFDVHDQIEKLQEHLYDENHRYKVSDMKMTLRKHAREERSIMFRGKRFTLVEIVQDLKSLDLETKKKAVKAACYMFLEHNPPGNAMVEAGIIALLVEALDRNACADIQLSAVMVFYLFIFKSSVKNKQAVADSGAITKLIALLYRGGMMSDMIAAMLGKMAAHGSETRDALLSYTRSDETALAEIRTYTWNLSLTSSRLYKSRNEVVHFLQILFFVTELLFVEDLEIIKYGCLICTEQIAILEIIGGIEAMQYMPRLTARLVALLGHEDDEVQQGAMDAVMNMFAGNDNQIERYFDASCLDLVISFLQSDKPLRVTLAAGVAGNIIKHTSLAQKALEKNILFFLRNVLLADGNLGGQRNAVFAIYNFFVFVVTDGSAAQRLQLETCGVLEPFCALLATSDPYFADPVLQGLSILVKNAKKDVKVKPLCLKLDTFGVIEHLQKWQEPDIEKNMRLTAAELSVTLRWQARGELLVLEGEKVFTLAEIVQELNSQELVTRTHAARAALRMLSEQDPPRTAMIQADVIAPLVAALGRDDCTELQIRAADSLAFIATGTHQHRVAVVNGGAIPRLIALLSRQVDVAVQAAQVLSILPGRSAVTAEMMLSHGAVQALLPHLQKSTPVQFLNFCLKVYTRLSAYTVTSSTFELMLPALPYISDLLEIEDHTILESACKAFTILTHNVEDRIEVVQAVPGLMTRIVALLKHPVDCVKKEAVNALTEMLGGNEIQISRCLDAGCLDLVVPLLQCSDLKVKEGAIAVIGNMLHTNSHSNIQRALEKGIHIQLLKTLKDAEPNSFLQFFTVVTLMHFSSGNDDHRIALVHSGVIPTIVTLLSQNLREVVLENCAILITNIAYTSPEIRDLMLTQGTVQAMLPYMQPDTPLDLLRACMHAYVNLCRDITNSTPTFEFVLPALPYVYKLLVIQDNVVLGSVCTAFHNLMRGSPELVDTLQAMPRLTERLVALLGHKEDDVKKVAWSAVHDMLLGADINATRCLDAGCVDHILVMLKSKELTSANDATCHILRMFRLGHTETRHLLEKDIITPLMQMIADAEPSSEEHRSAVYTLSVLAVFGTRKHRMAVVDSGALPELVAFLSYKTIPVETLVGCVQALRLIAEDKPEARELLRGHGAVRALLPLIMRPDATQRLLLICVAAFRSLCRHDETEISEKLKYVSPALPYILEVLNYGRREDMGLVQQRPDPRGDTPRTEIEYAISGLIDLLQTNEGIEEVQAVPGLTACLVALFEHKTNEVKIVVMKAVILMLSGTDSQVDRCCLGTNCIEYVISFLQCRDPALMQVAAEATRAALGPRSLRLQRALAKDVLNPLMSTLAFTVTDQKKTLKAISNMCLRATAAQRAQLVSLGVLELHCALLATPDRTLAGEVLDSLDVWLQVAVNDNSSSLRHLCLKLMESGILDLMKPLRRCENEEIKEKVCRLLNTFSSNQ